LKVVGTAERCVLAYLSVLTGSNDTKVEDKESFTHIELTKKSPIAALLSSIVLLELFTGGLGHP
jgi:hypothetical protein